MALQLKSDAGFWIDSPFGGPDVRFKLRDMDPIEEGRINAACTTYRFVKRDDGSEVIQHHIDEERKAWMGFNYVLVDWEGIEDGDGNPLPCTEQHKRMLFVQKGLGVQTMLLTYAKVKAEEFKADREMLKNSDASSSSGSTTRKSTANAASGGR